MNSYVLSKDVLKKIYKNATSENIDKFLEPLNVTISRYEINTPQRIRMFLAQVGHESGELRYVRELASGAAYEGRKDLGNTSPGDGVKYRGRGLIQITGKSNYAICGLALDLPLIDRPELLESPMNAAMSAGWYWHNKNLNSLADLNLFDTITRRINGGNNGEADRKRLYGIAHNWIN